MNWQCAEGSNILFHAQLNSASFLKTDIQERSRVLLNNKSTESIKEHSIAGLRRAESVQQRLGNKV